MKYLIGSSAGADTNASGTGTAVNLPSSDRDYTVQVVISSACTVNIQGSLDGTNYNTDATVTASARFVVSRANWMRATWSGNDDEVTVLIEEV